MEAFANFLAGFCVGALVMACMVMLADRPRPGATLCCGSSEPPCDDFHYGADSADHSYCERCHHHWSCHDIVYDTL